MSNVLRTRDGLPYDLVDGLRVKGVEITQLADTVTTNRTGALVGMIAHFPTLQAPYGWLAANGAAVSRTTYAGLFSLIGVMFGPGDGSTTFNLPDMRGEFLRGLDAGRGVDPGRVLGSSQEDELKNHTHTAPTDDGTGMNGNYEVPSTTDRHNYDYVAGAPVSGTGGVETRPRNVALLVCIKY